MFPFRLPHPPEESLLLGSALAMRRPDHHRSLRAWANELGGVYAIRIATWHVRCWNRVLTCACNHSTCVACWTQLRPLPHILV